MFSGIGIAPMNESRPSFEAGAEPLVSICVPSYNSAPYLQTLFNSLLSQTYNNIELIFTDDASTDESFSIALKYEAALRKAFPRVLLRQNTQNMGAVLNLHEMFKLTTGDLICYLDADDYYSPERVARLVRFFKENPDYGAVYSDYYAIEDGFRVNKELLSKNVPRAQGWIFEELLKSNFICAATMLVRREYFKRSYTFDIFRRRDYKMGDYPAYLQLSRIAKIGYVDEPLAYYRVRKSSMSHSEDAGESKALQDAIRRVKQDARLGVLRPEPLDPA
jgi:glycosyltransferase involved in cell wall biosynthesis